jgi:hypothetical protein
VTPGCALLFFASPRVGFWGALALIILGGWRASIAFFRENKTYGD